MNYAPSTFWYARPGAAGNVEPDPETAALAVALEQDDVVEVFRVKGAIEGEGMKIAERTGGKTQIQTLPEHKWSGNRQLWWIDGKPGDRLILTFTVEKAGTYEVSAELTKAVDYGIAQVLVNREAAGAPLDFFAREVTHQRYPLGTFDLRAGDNTIEFRLTGANPSAVKRHMVGIDYLMLKPAGGGGQ
jgi:hypothetical protein